MDNFIRQNTILMRDPILTQANLSIKDSYDPWQKTRLQIGVKINQANSQPTFQSSALHNLALGQNQIYDQSSEQNLSHWLELDSDICQQENSLFSFTEILGDINGQKMSENDLSDTSSEIESATSSNFGPQSICEWGRSSGYASEVSSTHTDELDSSQSLKEDTTNDYYERRRLRIIQREFNSMEKFQAGDKSSFRRKLSAEKNLNEVENLVKGPYLQNSKGPQSDDAYSNSAFIYYNDWSEIEDEDIEEMDRAEDCESDSDYIKAGLDQRKKNTRSRQNSDNKVKSQQNFMPDELPARKTRSRTISREFYEYISDKKSKALLNEKVDGEAEDLEKGPSKCSNLSSANMKYIKRRLSNQRMIPSGESIEKNDSDYYIPPGRFLPAPGNANNNNTEKKGEAAMSQSRLFTNIRNSNINQTNTQGFNEKNEMTSQSDGRRRHLLHFIIELLNKRHNCVEWVNKADRIFQITNPDQLTRLWGQYKKNTKMTFESLSRSLRLYYAPKKLERIQGRRHQYRLLHFPTKQPLNPITTPQNAKLCQMEASNLYNTSKATYLHSNGNQIPSIFSSHSSATSSQSNSKMVCNSEMNNTSLNIINQHSIQSLVNNDIRMSKRTNERWYVK